MGLFSKKPAVPAVDEKTIHEDSSSPASQTPANQSTTSLANPVVNPDALLEESKVTALALILGAVSSIGGFMFGYESGQISGMSSSPGLP